MCEKNTIGAEKQESGEFLLELPTQLRVNFCDGHFDLSGGDNHFSKELILFTALVSRTAKTAMKYSGTISISRSNSHTLCAEGEEFLALDLVSKGGGGLQEAVHETRYTSSTSFVSFKS